mmetsp:Transcript_19695/g.48993  ORF Transcript_19695/g.48993 Transcript_19695/m.48993 type:complete len:207 (-) Transcript_19695:77-697(-)
MSHIQKCLEQIGFNLPDRQRIKATKTTSVRMEPQGTIRVTHAIDTFVDGKVDKSKDNLVGKKLVLFFAKESNYLSRAFLVPKMTVIYQQMIAERDDVEFLFVGLTQGQTKVEYERFAKSMPWPSVPYEDTARRQFLEDVFYTPLKKKNGLCGIVVLGEDRDEILSIDAEPKLSATHDDTGKDFPWKVEAAETCCAAASTLVLCTIS